MFDLSIKLEDTHFGGVVLLNGKQRYYIMKDCEGQHSPSMKTRNIKFDIQMYIAV